MSDVIDGSITPVVANAAVNAGGKLLKVVELQMRYGTIDTAGEKKLHLCGNDDAKAKALEEIAARRRELDEAEQRIVAPGD